MKKNKLKLFWPLLALGSFVILCCACGVNVIQTVEGLIPIVGAIMGIAGTVGETLLPAEASLIGEGMALANNGLTALLATLKSYDANKSAPGTLAAVQAAFNAVHTNLAQLLVAAQVKDPLTAQKLTGVVNGVIATTGLIEAYVVTKAPPTATQVVQV
jgi:hypothetical protein